MKAPPGNATAPATRGDQGGKLKEPRTSKATPQNRQAQAVRCRSLNPLDVRQAIERKAASAALLQWDDDSVAILADFRESMEDQTLARITGAMVDAAEDGIARQAATLPALSQVVGTWLIKGLLNERALVTRADLEAHRELGEIVGRIVEISEATGVIV